MLCLESTSLTKKVFTTVITGLPPRVYFVLRPLFSPPLMYNIFFVNIYMHPPALIVCGCL